MLFDTHAHYDDEKFNEDREEVLGKVLADGVGYILNAASTLESIDTTVELTNSYENLYGAVGIHPHNAGQLTDEVLVKIMELAKLPKIVAIGEIGLDYYYDFSPREEQQICLKKQIDLAKSVNLPIIIHNRDSHEDIMRILKEEKASVAGGVFHCFTGSVEMARILLDNNFYISFGGPITFKNAKKAIEVLKTIPEDRLLIETDCPYLTPEPHRGKRNDSGYLKFTAEKLAEIRGWDFEKTAALTTSNARKLFRIL